MTRCTSVSERKFALERQFGAQGGEPELLEPEQPSAAAATRTSARAAARRPSPGTARLRDGRGLRPRGPRVARVVEPVAQHAARGDFPFHRLRSAVALAAGF